MTSSKTPNHIPHYITGSTLMALKNAMLRNNIQLASYIHYFDISQVEMSGKKVFVAWFYKPIDDEGVLDSLSKGD
jgi:hypothetical protein